ncbi:PREDICTED: uncharacterized protein LOC106323043 [Brassica oleracea var. oleracea]|uniref:uncharacterized protein LOC106323043 n=1 Tax=Brassica oleracea var. oleracea TaxID=109376 RepID=UPI0006A6DE68|nr:PREDICTED: uncharacterized protein LOC106323043 [Brassica oleracea var. oleracea]
MVLRNLSKSPWRFVDVRRREDASSISIFSSGSITPAKPLCFTCSRTRDWYSTSLRSIRRLKNLALVKSSSRSLGVSRCHYFKNSNSLTISKLEPPLSTQRQPSADDVKKKKTITMLILKKRKILLLRFARNVIDVSLSAKVRS